MRKRLVFLLLGVVMSLGLVTAFAQETEPSINVTGEVSFLNRYVWRGMRLTDGPVMQPAATISVGGFSVNAWGNFELDDVTGHENKFTELDLTANYTLSLEAVDIFVGGINYQFPNTDFDSTSEVYAGVTANVLFSPTVTVYRDIDLIEGTYVNFGLSHDIEIEGTDGAIHLFGNLGFGDKDYTLGYFGVEKNAFTDFSVGGSLSMSLMQGITIAPTVIYTNLIDGDISDLYAEPDNLIYGVKLGFEF